LLVDEPAYPDALRAAWPELGAPLWLFTSGRPLCVADTIAVAVVGTRTPTLDGLRTTRSVAGALARAGAVVVSGLARGIDQAAHDAALEAGGQTIAVLGTGLGVDYPAGSASLRSAIIDRGALLTEFAPGVSPRSWHFLARNRIISGLAVATVVVEGGPTSGALQTARMAAGQGRDVWAVPGSINAPTSQAPLALLRDGAHPLTSVDVFLEALGLQGDGSEQTADGGHAPAIDGLSHEARTILRLLGAVPATTDALVAAARLPVDTTMAAVAELIQSGFAVATRRGVVRP
jgi:DNA processing protein